MDWQTCMASLEAVCACQRGVKAHGFCVFFHWEFVSLRAPCRMRGGVTLSRHDRVFAVQRWLNNFAAQP